MFSNGIGIDISDAHLRLAWLSHDGSIRALKEVVLPAGLVIDDEIRKPEMFKQVTRNLLEDPGLSGLKGRVTILVPESRVFVTSLTVASNQRLEDVEQQALKTGQEQMPIRFQEAAIDVEFGPTSGESRTVAVLATASKTVNALIASLEELEMPIIAVESNNGAVHRLVRKYSPATGAAMVPMIFDVGSSWANVSLYNSDGVPLLSRSVKLTSLETGGGEKLSATRMVKLCDILAETVGFFESQQRPTSIFLAGTGGGGADIVQTCTERLRDLAVSRIQDIVKIDRLSAEEIQTFGAAIGAAERSIKPRQYYSKHNFKDSISYAAKK